MRLVFCRASFAGRVISRENDPGRFLARPVGLGASVLAVRGQAVGGMLLIAIVALTLGMVYMDVQFNTWRAVRVPGELHERGQQLVGADKAPKDP